MKINGILVSLALAMCSIAAMAQVENDDMYFNSKDRAKLKAQQASEQASYSAINNNQYSNQYSKQQDQSNDQGSVNPTDSYSARNVNPEYSARANASVAQNDNGDYFLNNYSYNTNQNLRNFSSNYNSWSNSRWYTTGYYGPSIYNWNSPYYGYSSPWANPYSGMSLSFGYYSGSNYGYWGNPYAYSYCNPYSFYSPYSYYGYGNSWDPYYGYGYGSYYGGYGSYYGSYYPNVVVVTGSRYSNYGKRSSRSYAGNANNSYHYPTAQNSNVQHNSSGSRSDYYGGRQNTHASSQPQPSNEYYSRSWRRVSQQPTTGYSNGGYTGGRSGDNSGRTSQNQNSSWWNNSSNNSGTRSHYSGGSFTPSHSSGSSFGGGGSHSGSYGGGGGSHSRSHGH